MAVAAKQKGPASDSLMAPDKMKPLLALSKRDPVQAAIGLTTDGDGLILLDKKAKPKKVLSMLRAEAGKAKLQLNTSSLRFGRAEVDTEYDSGMVRFFINKDAPGNMRVKLLEVVKRIPYQKVEINVDPSLEQEPEDEAEGTESGAAQSPPQSAVPPDAATLRNELAALARRIAGVPNSDPTLKAGLARLANDVNVHIKGGDLAAAADFIAQLRDSLDAAGTGTDQAVPPNGQASPSPTGRQDSAPDHAGPKEDTFTQQWQRSFVAFRDAVETVDGQMDGLAAACRQTDDPWLQRIADLGLPAVTGNFKTPLMTACLEVSGASGDKVAAAAAKARTAVANFAQHLATNPQVAGCDGNPFGVPVSIRATLGPALKSLNDALRLAR
jgi:hypothetical protein